MGNGCFCCKSSYKPDVQLDSFGEKNTKPIINNNISDLSKYFNEGGKEINNNKEKREKSKRKSNILAKNLISINTMDNPKYELMLKRLLEQKEKERHGPKRRTTIRVIDNNEEIKKLVQEVIQEKIGDNNNQTNKNSQINKRGSLLLNLKEKKKLAYRSTMILSGEQVNNLKNMASDINCNNTNIFVANGHNKNTDETTNIK